MGAHHRALVNGSELKKPITISLFLNFENDSLQELMLNSIEIRSYRYTALW